MNKNIFKIIAAICLLLCLVCILVCVHNDNKIKGIDKLMNYTIPKDYKVEKNIIYDDNGELTSIHYGKKDTSIYFIMLSHKGKAIMGSDETIDEWYDTQENILKEYNLRGATSKMYIYYPIAFSLGESDKKDMIEGVFDYNGYVIMIGITNYQGNNLTEEEINTYYSILKSIKFK